MVKCAFSIGDSLGVITAAAISLLGVRLTGIRMTGLWSMPMWLNVAMALELALLMFGPGLVVQRMWTLGVKGITFGEWIWLSTGGLWLLAFLSPASGPARLMVFFFTTSTLASIVAFVCLPVLNLHRSLYHKCGLISGAVHMPFVIFYCLMGLAMDPA